MARQTNLLAMALEAPKRKAVMPAERDELLPTFERLRQSGVTGLVLCIDASLNCADADLPDGDVTVAHGFAAALAVLGPRLPQRRDSGPPRLGRGGRLRR